MHVGMESGLGKWYDRDGIKQALACALQEAQRESSETALRRGYFLNHVEDAVGSSKGAMAA